MVRMYFPTPIAGVVSAKTPEEIAKALNLVTTLMAITNIAAAAEAIAFAHHMRVDLRQFYTLVNDAAGASYMFKTRGAEMIDYLLQKETGQTEKEKDTGDAPVGSMRIDDAVAGLSAIVQAARDLNCPLHLGSEALNVFLLAQRRGWGSKGVTSVLRVWTE